MPYRIEWLVTDRVLFVEISGSLTDAEQPVFFQTIADLSIRSPYQVHLVVDMTEQKQRLTIRQATQMALKHPMPRNLGWVVQVGKLSQPQVFLSSLIAQFFSVTLYAVDEMDEALAHLRFHDPTIDWLLADYSVLSKPEGCSDYPLEECED
ncbi:MAG: hypothetical protein KC496_15435 [Anaerolineae bacterium]|nr:hypothetical protein [Anaerolineae bacterium]